jgi:hypothetical protein
VQAYPAMQASTNSPQSRRVTRRELIDIEVSQGGASPSRRLPHNLSWVRAVRLDMRLGSVPVNELLWRMRALHCDTRAQSLPITTGGTALTLQSSHTGWTRCQLIG